MEYCHHYQSFPSGQEATVAEALPKLETLFHLSRALTDGEVWGLTILLGSGINSKTVPEILSRLLPLGLREIHLSGGQWISNDIAFKRLDMGMGFGGESDWGIWRTQTDEIREVRKIVNEMLAEFIPKHNYP